MINFGTLTITGLAKSIDWTMGWSLEMENEGNAIGVNTYIAIGSARQALRPTPPDGLRLTTTKHHIDF